jgi:hypothetical protein
MITCATLFMRLRVLCSPYKYRCSVIIVDSVYPIGMNIPTQYYVLIISNIYSTNPAA